MRHQSGFTLIELMIVVAVLGIIAAIAFPAYADYLREGRRAEAVNGVGKYQMAQERWRAEHTTFGTSAQIFPSGAPTSEFYTFSTTDGATYTITAEPIGKMAGDSCGNLVATSNGTTKPQWSGGGSCNK